MTKGIFITATGTDVGKTYISALLVHKLRKFGKNCGYYKPALSGAVNVSGKIIPGDCDYVLNFAGIDKEPEHYVSYIFEPAVSPHLASVMSNRPIHMAKIREDFSRIKQEFEYLVVEGAGGIVCPFNLSEGEKILLPDVIKDLGLSVLVVASASLGTINSTVLTVEYARKLGIKVKGIILNNYDENDVMQNDNKIQVEILTGVRVVATVKTNDKELNIDEKVLREIFDEV